VDRHAPACLRFATRMLGNREDAEDATQEALVRAYRGLGGYDPQQRFRTWLFAILVNRCRTALLRRRRRERRIVLDDEALAHAEVAPALGGSELGEVIARAVARLERGQREAFLLKHVEDLSYDEMAAVTGLGVSALKMRVKRACDRLQELLAEVSDDVRS
jgi:RNA polymerase sigma-70 factor, ECF subfamily